MLLSWNAHPRRERLSRPQVAACLRVTEPSSHYWQCWAVVCPWPAGCLCAQAAWGQGGRRSAKTNTLCWNPDSPHRPNSASERCSGCLNCSLDLAQCHAKDPGICPRCFLANEFSKYLEHRRVQCQGMAPPWRVTGSSLCCPCWSQSACSVPRSSRAEYYPEEQILSVGRVAVFWVFTQHQKWPCKYCLLIHKLIQKSNKTFFLKCSAPGLKQL